MSLSRGVHIPAPFALLALLALLARHAPVAHASKCTCVPPTDEAKAAGWWDYLAVPPPPAPQRVGTNGGEGKGYYRGLGITV
jgi:hypothetical protein